MTHVILKCLAFAVAVVCLSTLGAVLAEDAESKEGAADVPKEESRQIKNRFVFFKWDTAASDFVHLQDEYVSVGFTINDQGYTQRLPLTQVREGLWVLDTWPLKHGLTIESVGFIGTDAKGTKALSVFTSDKWATSEPIDLTSLTRKDVPIGDSERGSIYRWQWISINPNDLEYEIKDGDTVECIVDEWITGSTFWVPMIRINDDEFVRFGGSYSGATSLSDPGLSDARVRVFSKSGALMATGKVAVKVTNSSIQAP